MKFKLTPRVYTYIADADTPISLYLKIRENFPETLLMESNGSKSNQPKFSYICCLPIATISLKDNNIRKLYPDGKIEIKNVDEETDVIAALEDFNSSFEINTCENLYDTKGLYGYFAYDSIQFFDSIKLTKRVNNTRKVDDMHFSFYKLVLIFDHLKQECHVIEYDNDFDNSTSTEFVKSLLAIPISESYPFNVSGNELENCTNDEFLQIVEKGKQHCYRGDVFQIVLSRCFTQEYSGDDFNVYRKLRSINPSPYLFYFDYGQYRLFGASPETQLVVNNNKACIHAIAGTYKRTGNVIDDELQISKLKEDEKENAEHVMLVDLARNDLSKNFKEVSVTAYKDIVQYSHVIHMVSEITGAQAIKSAHSLRVMADTFPAGTLSGAPKYRAMQLIEKYEPEARGFYGGSIGYIGFNGDINQAIMIRTILSKDQKLFYQAGAGVVSSSISENELQEVNNKLQALRTAIELANTY